MTLLSDEIIEKAARAAYQLVREESNCDVRADRDCLECGTIATKVARAALSAVFPDLVEECAKVADDEVEEWEGVDPRAACMTIASSIRSLITQENGK